MATPPSLNDRFIKNSHEISIISEYTFCSTNHFWNRRGRKMAAYNQVEHQAVDLFAEYGLTTCDTIGIYASYAQNQEEMNRSPRGISDFDLVWKHLFTKFECWDLSFQCITVIPAGESLTTIRYGEWGLETDLHAQRNFFLFGNCGWIELLMGYRFYQNNPSDRLISQFVVGQYMTPDLTLVGECLLDYCFKIHKHHSEGPLLFLPLDYRLLKLQAQIIWKATCSINLFLGGSLNLWGQNIGTGAALIGGVWFDS